MEIKEQKKQINKGGVVIAPKLNIIKEILDKDGNVIKRIEKKAK